MSLNYVDLFLLDLNLFPIFNGVVVYVRRFCVRYLQISRDKLYIHDTSCAVPNSPLSLSSELRFVF